MSHIYDHRKHKTKYQGSWNTQTALSHLVKQGGGVTTQTLAHRIPVSHGNLLLQRGNFGPVHRDPNNPANQPPGQFAGYDQNGNPVDSQGNPLPGVINGYDQNGNPIDAYGQPASLDTDGNQLPPEAYPSQIPPAPPPPSWYQGPIPQQPLNQGYQPSPYFAPPQPPNGYDGYDPSYGFDPSKYVSSDEMPQGFDPQKFVSPEEAYSQGYYISGFFDDIGDAFSSAAKDVGHELEKYKPEIEAYAPVAAGAVATAFGGPEAGATAAQVAGIATKAAYGDMNAKQVLASAIKLAAQNPQAAPIVQAGTDAVKSTAIAAHATDIVQKAMAGDSHAQGQVTDMVHKAVAGNPAAQYGTQVALASTGVSYDDALKILQAA